VAKQLDSPSKSPGFDIVNFLIDEVKRGGYVYGICSSLGFVMRAVVVVVDGVANVEDETLSVLIRGNLLSM